MANLRKVIYINEEDYSTLINGDSLVIDGTTYTYEENALYVIKNAGPPEYAETAGYATNAGTSQVAVSDASGNNIAATYEKKPLVIEVNESDSGTTLEQGTYDSITQALALNRLVILKLTRDNDDNEILYLPLLIDYTVADNIYLFIVWYGTHTNYTVEINNHDEFYYVTNTLAKDNVVVHKEDTETISGDKTFTGTVSLGSKATATTPAATDNDTSVATTAFVHNVVNSIPEITTGQIVGRMHRDNVSGTGNLTITGASGEGFNPNGITTASKYIVVVYSWSDTKTFGYNISFGSNSYTLSTTDGTISDKRELTVSAGALWSGSITTAVSAGTTIIVEIYKSEKTTQALSVGTVALTNLYNDLDGKPTISSSTSSTSTTDIASSKAVKLAYDHGGVQSVNGQTGAVVLNIPTKTSDLTNDSNFTTLSEVTLTIVNSAPETLDTLNELAAALGDDPNFATTVATQIGQKYTKPSTGIPASDLAAGVIPNVPVQSVNGMTGAVTIDLSDYDKKPLIIEINDTNTTVPSGTYASITAALAAGRKVILKKHWTADNSQILYMSLVEDYSDVDQSYSFVTLIDNNKFHQNKINANDTVLNYEYELADANGSLDNYFNVDSLRINAGVGENASLDASYSSNNDVVTIRFAESTLGSDISYTFPETEVHKTIATTDQIPTKTSDLTNDSGFITDAGVTSVNGLFGEVVTKLSIDYTPSTLINEDLILAPDDTYEEAFSKLEKTINDNEEITAAALTDLDERIPIIDQELSETSENPVQNKVITQAIIDNEYVVSTALNNINDRLENKQDTLISGTNIKTINNLSLLGTGNINISNIEIIEVNANIRADVTKDGTITVDDTTAITKNLNTTNLQYDLNNDGLVTISDVSLSSNIAVNKPHNLYIDIETNPYSLITTSFNNSKIPILRLVFPGNLIKDILIQKTNNTPVYYGEDIYAIQIPSSGNGINLSETILKIFVQISETEANGIIGHIVTKEGLSTKQDTLVSGTNIKTINNESILGSGNITIQGGSGGDTNVIETVKVNGTALTPDSNKAVNISTVTSFNGNTGAITYTAPVTSVNGQTGAVTLALGQTNVIETIKVNGTALTPDSNKAVDIKAGNGTISNTLNLGTFVSDTYINQNNGQEVTYTGWSSTDYIALDDDVIQIKSSKSLPYSALYDSNKNFLSVIKLNNTFINIEDVKYIRLSGSNSDMNSVVVTTRSTSNVDIWIPANTSDLTNDSGFLTSAPVTSVNGQTGAVTLTIPDAVTESTVSGWGFTKNTGTITGITMNGSSKGTSGVVNLGTVITEHQDISGKANTADLATVATSGSYNDLSNKPTIPAAQVQSDWNATSGMGAILNKPTIPTVNNATLTIQKNGTTVNTFTANASSNVTANIQVNELPTVSSSDNGKILQVVNGAWSLVTPVTVYTGTSAPNSSLGINGDLYVLTS